MKDGNLPVRLRWSEGQSSFRSRWKAPDPLYSFYRAVLMITVCFGSAYAMAVSGTTTLFPGAPQPGTYTGRLCPPVFHVHAAVRIGGHGGSHQERDGCVYC